MRTTLDLDDDLMAALTEALPGRSKTEALEEAIRAYLRKDTVAYFRSLAGTIDIDDDVWIESRARDRQVGGA
jgi:Arc/MetJ family transcription regulator